MKITLESLPQKNDCVCHYEHRQPLTVLDAKQNLMTGEIVFTLQDSSENTFEAPIGLLEHYPSVGDRCLIMPGPYIDWLRRSIARESSDMKRFMRERDELDPIQFNFPRWLIGVHTIDRTSLLNGEPVAFFNYEQERKRCPIAALKVLQKANAQIQEKSA